MKLELEFGVKSEGIQLVKVKLSSKSPFALNVMGLELSKTNSEPVAFPSLIGALVRYSDANLEFTFEESDRENLMQLDTDLFDILSKELGTDITTHEQLCGVLLPKKKKTKPKKVVSAPKPVDESE